MNRFAKLTDVDRLILESYKSVLEGLSEYLGNGYEMVLHSLEDIDRSAIKVINGHYSNRKKGAPLTDLAMEMLAKIKKSGDSRKNLIYFNRTKKGAQIRSATLPIVGSKNQIIGLLCINFYMDIPLYSFLSSIVKLNGNGSEIIETYASDTDELIISSVNNARTQALNDMSISASNKNKEIISILFYKGIFKLKDAVIKVAAYLGISKNTVYMHIRNLEENNEKNST